MANGCGPEGGMRIFGIEFKAPHRAFFHTSCDKHDDLYEEGGNEIDRLIADIYLYEYMKQDIYNLQPYYKIPYYLIWASLYYRAVRIGGGANFTYKKNKGG